MELNQILLQISNNTFFNDIENQKFTSRFLINVISVIILIRVIYYTNYRRTDLFLTFFGFNIIIFLITYLLNKVEMSMGAAFGLFAIFSMLRYRTEGISAKDMTYLFIVIALGLITAISIGDWKQLAVAAGILLALTYGLESGFLIKKELSKNIIYDRIDLILPEKRNELLSDLNLRTGLKVMRVDIHEYDFLKDATKITIYYQSK